jgi:hypothetical protein
MKRVNRIIAAFAVMVFGPLFGILIGAIAGVLAMPHGSANTGRSPGDGFLIIGTALAGSLVAIPLSILLAHKIWIGWPPNQNSSNTIEQQSD